MSSAAAPGWGSWSFNPIIALALVAAVVVYARMYRRASARATTPPNAGHWLPYGLGIFVLVVALFSPLDEVGDRYLLSAHMMQHVLLADIAPALLDPRAALADAAARPLAQRAARGRARRRIGPTLLRASPPHRGSPCRCGRSPPGCGRSRRSSTTPRSTRSCT